MSCDVRIVSAGPMPVWSNRQEGPNVGLFIHLTAFMSAAEVERVRCTLEIRSNSGEAEILPGYQVANEATSPGSSYQIGSQYEETEDIHYGTSFTDISGNLGNQQLVRFGVFVRNTASSAGQTELALVTLKVEIQARA